MIMFNIGQHDAMLLVVGSSLFQLPIQPKKSPLLHHFAHDFMPRQCRPFSVESAICRVAIHHFTASISVWHDDDHDTSFDKWDNDMIHDSLYKISALRPIFYWIHSSVSLTVVT